ncbi:MAG TPA: hypothetical protein VIM96_06265 [Pseudomonadales bacterium]
MEATTCSKCGHVRSPEDNTLSALVCPRCGAVYAAVKVGIKHKAAPPDEAPPYQDSMSVAAAKRLSKPLPAYVSWITRFVAYAFALVVILVIVVSHANANLTRYAGECFAPIYQGVNHDRAALSNAKLLYACMAGQSNAAEKFMLRQTRDILALAPHAPCQYVGTWAVSRGGLQYEMTLSSDAEYTVVFPNGEANDAAGSWSEYQGALVWFNNEGVIWPFDMNKIVDIKADQFSLLEKNKSITHFALIERGEDECH